MKRTSCHGSSLIAQIYSAQTSLSNEARPKKPQTQHVAVEVVVMNDTTDTTRNPFERPFKATFSMLPCFAFLYINCVMLFALLRKPVLLESSRYILFGHLLFTDSLQLLLTMLLYIFAATAVKMMNHVCITITLFAAMSLQMSPLNIAMMSLERYIAISFPLRHADIATTRRTGIAIAVTWSLVSIDSVIKVFVFVSLENTRFTMSGFCTKESVFQLRIYTTMDNAFVILYFTIVTVIVVCTYIAILITVKSASSNARDASKAPKTVLLHLLQLCMCLVSTLFSMLDSSSTSKIAHDIRYALFVTLIIFPKCLSPLIYGLRDETLRKVFILYFTSGFKCTAK